MEVFGWLLWTVIYGLVRLVCLLLRRPMPERLRSPLTRQSPAERRGPSLPAVEVNAKFASPTEQVFYRVLRDAAGDGCRVWGQVALNRLVRFQGNPRTPGRAFWFNKIKARSIDFVVVEARSLRPLVAVELDDASHNRADRQQRDAEVEAVLRAAGLPIVRFTARRSYETDAVRNALRPHLATLSATATAPRSAAGKPKATRTLDYESGSPERPRNG